MNVFVVFQNTQPAFLGLKQRRKSEEVPKWSIFGEFFANFGTFLSKKVSFFAKIERNGEVFDLFEKGAVVFALNLKIRTYDDFAGRVIMTYG